ncbi:peptidase C39-like protein [Prosthecobacter fusiformis]|uniref:Peptidase C39-like protein n=1 Tax=Prosthecobacter fusiformis TaxID=48464 RepID=A0A4R7SS73_9BACT|nr:C39 family peptidase [Prosthecobacter fusiformis]TDU81336.1 peptidase C39-like protein [Prosthecobacter fusiformis]
MRICGKIILLPLLCLALLRSAAAQAPAQINLDAILDLADPFATSLDQFKALLDPVKPHHVAPGGAMNEPDLELYGWNLGASSTVSVFDRQFTLHELNVYTSNVVPGRYSFTLNLPSGPNAHFQMLADYLTLKLTVEAKDSEITIRGTPERKEPMKRWDCGTHSIAIFKSAPDLLMVTVSAGGSTPASSPTSPFSAQINHVDVDLDLLLNLPGFWSTTPEKFDQIYRAKTEKPQEQLPQFEWLNAGKTRARFSRKMYTNLEANISMFGRFLKVEEAIVEFVNNRAARVTISLYNRGDTGDIDPTQFSQLFKKTGQHLGQILKVAPRNQSASISSAVKTVSWQWQTAAGIALLEHNDYSNSGGRPEFLRVKLASPDQADWSMGKLTVGVQRMALLNNITKTAEGDVYIAGVPMVDQGAKGYCVAASCQRLFEYMQIPCDQHEIAQLVSVDAENGANILTMQKSLAKIDGQYKVAFKPFINPEIYYSGGKRRVSLRQFSIIVKEHVDKGIPLLWALELGHFPEDPPLPNGGQVSGGHMRMIIGYNSAKNQVLFTDSWGAGHELKRMSENAGYEVTMGLYSMSPRGL